MRFRLDHTKEAAALMSRLDHPKEAAALMSRLDHTKEEEEFFNHQRRQRLRLASIIREEAAALRPLTCIFEIDAHPFANDKVVLRLEGRLRHAVDSLDRLHLLGDIITLLDAG